MGANSNSEVLNRIQSALEAARQILGRFTAGAIEAEYKAGHDPVTEADKCVDAVLRKELLREGEFGLSIPWMELENSSLGYQNSASQLRWWRMADRSPEEFAIPQLTKCSLAALARA